MGISLLGMRPVPHDRTHTWHYDGNQEPVARQAIAPRGDPTSITLQKGCSIKWLLRTYHYTYRWVPLSTLIREVTFCSKWWLSQRPTVVKVMRVRGHRVLIPKGGIYIKGPPPGTQVTLQKRAAKIARAGGTRKLQWNYVFQIQKVNSMWIQQCLWQHAHTVQWQVKQKSQHEGGGRYKSTPLSMRYWQFIASGRGRSSFL